MRRLPQPSMTIDIEARTIIKIIAVLLAVVLLYLLRDVLVILFFAIMIASAVGPFASWLEERRIPRLLSVIVLYLVFFGLIGVLLSLVIPVLSYELSQLAQALPKFFAGVNNALENAQGSRYFGFLGDLQGILDSFSKFLQVSSGSLISFIINIFGGIISFVAIIVLSFYLSVMKQGVSVFFKSLLPEAYQEYAIGLWKRAEFKVGKWFQGQLLLALAVGLVVFVGLSLLHVKYALLLGIIAMIFEIVPIVGPVLSAIPGLMLAFTQSPTLGLWVLLFYLVVQQLEGHVLAPLILGKTLGLHPVTVVIALLIGAKLAGILGILLAVPVAVVIVEVLDDMAEQRQSRKAVPT